MNPVAINLFGIEIRWYAIIIVTGIIAAYYLVQYRAGKRNIDKSVFETIVLYAVPSAIVGARIYYVVFEWDSYGGDFLKMINIRAGGMAIHGGVLFGVLSAYIVCKIKKYPFIELLDLVSPSLILGQAIGRWGNFMNNEAHGGPTDLPWAINVDGVNVHPTFLYESLWNFLVLAILLFIAKKFYKFRGQIFLSYLILYSFARYFIEGLRTDSLYVFGFRTAQLVSVLLILVSIVFYIVLSKKNKIRKND